MRATAHWPKHRLFKYERNLAEAELRSLGATGVSPHVDGVAFDHARPKRLLDRVTYFACLEFGGTMHPCTQREVELAHLRTRSSRARQATRFGVHGFHEYKGKFNPQLARALVNVVDPKARVLADPFAGSGTALIEALRLGLNSHGRDRSPIAVFLSTAKLKAHTASDPGQVATELSELAETVGSALKRGQDSGSVASVANWASRTHHYLSEWFTPPAFAALREALSDHPSAKSSVAAHLSLLALSSILRSVSLQEPQDLRVRRRTRGFIAPSLRDAYSDVVDRLVSSLSELEPWTADRVATSRLGNADDSDLFMESKGRRLIVTSPPYATALPYIDTDRLSIMALGLATPSEARELEASLTGSREWSTRTAKAWRQAMLEDRYGLPKEVTLLLAEIEAANIASKAGFRRAAVPSLLYRYFVAMRRDFASWHRQLRAGERAVVVMGRNRTGARDGQITIETPHLLVACAEQVGFSVAEYIPLETWPRYGIHAANAVDAEDAVVLQG
jgi:site-specific DNA-methyltransferase (cytosine-N4-specific)